MIGRQQNMRECRETFGGGGGGAGADDAGHHPIYVNRGRFRRLCQAVRSI